MEQSFKSHRLQAAKTPEPGAEKAAVCGNPEAPGKPQIQAKPQAQAKPREIGGPSGPEPTRYGDWERNGICYDF